MTKDEQRLIGELLQYHKRVRGVQPKAQVRNRIYFLLQPWLMRWIYSILRKWHVYVDQQELLSLSWHCFIHALDRYRNTNVPVPFHFYTYSLYYLYLEYKGRGREILQEELELPGNCPRPGLYQFYHQLPKNLRPILHDILSKQSRHKAQANYYQHKKVIKSLLKELYE